METTTPRRSFDESQVSDIWGAEDERWEATRDGLVRSPERKELERILGLPSSPPAAETLAPGRETPNTSESSRGHRGRRRGPKRSKRRDEKRGSEEAEAQIVQLPLTQVEAAEEPPIDIMAWTAEETVKRKNVLERVRSLWVQEHIQQCSSGASSSTSTAASQGKRTRNELRADYTKIPWSERVAMLKKMQQEERLPQAEKAVAEKLLESLGASSSCAENPSKTSFLSQSRGAQYTWQGDWSYAMEASALYEISPQTPELVVAGVRESPYFNGIWRDFGVFVDGLRKKFSYEKVTQAMELCCDTLKNQGLIKVHIHLMWDRRERLRIRNSTPLLFKGQPPYVSASWEKCRGNNQRKVFNQGHYYLSYPKIGSVFRLTNWPPHESYCVSPEWITQQWSSNKMTSESAIAEYVSCKRNVTRYVTNVNDQRRLQEELETEEEHAFIRGKLRARLTISKKVPEVEAWMADFSAGTLYQRRRFLVLEGESGLGKTIFARGIEGEEHTLELNCCNSEEPDLRQYQERRHRAIIFDEASPRMVAAQRKLFQGPAVAVELSSTKTHMFAYKVWVWRTKMIICSNSWTSVLQELKEDDQTWLRANSVHYMCTEKLWEEDGGALGGA